MPDSPILLAVNGAAGRMGQRVIACALRDGNFALAAAIESAHSPRLGQDAALTSGAGESGIRISETVPDHLDVVVDFSTPAGLERITAICQERRVPLVAATTGLSEQQRQQITDTANLVPVVFAPSMSLSVNIAMKLAQEAARAMTAIPGGVDVEIVERHHRFKEDAPSGTALRFGKLIAEELGQTEHVHGRSGNTGPRSQQEIGYHALRTGDNIGEHTIIFGVMGESLELTVRSNTRDAYALGALAAARFVVNQPPGLYNMAQVLEL